MDEHAHCFPTVAGSSASRLSAHDRPSPPPPRAVEALERRLLLSAATFVPSGHYEFNSTPRDTAVADFNGDSIPDTASILPTDTVVGVLLNQGDGTFQRAPLLQTDSSRAIVAADFNHDGRIDLAVIGADSNNSGDGVVSVFLGNGDGTFARPPAKYHLPAAGPEAVATDLNADGWDDLVVLTGKKVAILINQQNGLFSKQIAYPIGGEHPTALTVGDFNGDAVPDVAVAHGKKSRVTVLLANPAAPGTFGLPTFFPTGGENVSGVTSADFNHDGVLDLAVTNSQFKGNTLAVLIGNGDGTFRAPAFYGGANFAEDVIAGDFSGSGNADIVLGSFDSPLKLFSGYGDGTFSPPTVIPEAQYTQYIRSADFNGDGLPDLVVTPYTGVRFDFNTTPVPNIPTPPGPGQDKILGAGSPKSFEFYTPEGTIATISVAGPGSALLHFSASQPIAIPKGRDIINATALTLTDIAVAGTTTASTLSISTRAGSNTLNLDSISADSAIGAINAPRANLTGNLTLPAGVGRLNFLSASNGVLALGPGAKTALQFQALGNETITAQSAIASIEVRLDASVTLTAPSIGTFSTGGSLLDSTIALTAPYSASAANLGRLSAQTGIARSTIFSAGNITTINAQYLVDSTINAGVATLLPGQVLPISTANFIAAASIKTVTLVTDSRRSSFANSGISAYHESTLNLGLIQMNNGGTAHGVAAHSIAKLQGADLSTGRHFHLANVTSSASAAASLADQNIDPQDFTVRIL